MHRYAFRIEYHGAGYSGWQRQDNQISVQEVLETALSRLESSGQRTVAAGRTDSGVHAWGQVVHADLGKDWDPFRLREALNAHLRRERVRVLDTVGVDREFSARHSALERVYRYRILCRRPPPGIDEGLVWHIACGLDLGAMRQAASHLTGKHDFTTFRSAHCQSVSPVKTLRSIELESIPYRGGVEIVITARARSFLHRQVRSIVGTLERVGTGAVRPAEVGDMLAARDRSRCGPVAPAHGLYLADVEYRPDPFLQDR